MGKALAAVAVIVAVMVVVTAAYVLTWDDDGDVIYRDAGDVLDMYSSDGDVVAECRSQHDGFAFTGWNTSADGSGAWHMPGDTWTYLADRSSCTRSGATPSGGSATTPTPSCSARR